MTAVLSPTATTVAQIVTRARRMDAAERELLHKQWVTNAATCRQQQIRVAYRLCQALTDDFLGEHLDVRAGAYAAAHQPGSPWWGAPAAVSDVVFAVLAGDGISAAEWWMFAGPFRSLFPEVDLPVPPDGGES